MKHQIFMGIAFLAASAVIGTVNAQEEAQEAEQAAVQPAETRVYDIDAGDLGRSLDQFAEQNGYQIGYPPDLVAGKSAPALQGEFSAIQALERLLAGSGLEAEFVNDRAIVLRRIPAAANTIGQRRPGIEEIIVTGQKREERIQDVPIAISAFSPEDLHAQKIEGGFDLLKGVPNVSFSKTNFSGYNFQIRGIGTQAVSATTDPAVAVSFNNTTLIVNRLFEQEYLDVERVEVLRGPQGTLFGRNATSGVINVISAKPELGVWDGELKVEAGNFNARRLRGMFNAPIGDTLAIRGAYASTKRDGYGINEAAADQSLDASERPSRDVDGRDLWTGRLTLGWQPTDALRFNLLWERFEEDDNRVRTSKQLCHRDRSDFVAPEGFAESTASNAGPDFVTEDGLVDVGEYFYGPLSQGCKAGSLYTDGAFGTPNGTSLPYVSGLFFGSSLGNQFAGAFNLGGNPYRADPGFPPFIPSSPPFIEPPCEVIDDTRSLLPVDVCNADVYRGLTQSRDLRTIFSKIEPQYRAEADIVELSFDLELTDNLLFSSQTVYAKDEYWATQDYNRFTSFPLFTDSTLGCDLIQLGPITSVDCPPTTPFSQPYADGFYTNLSPRPEDSTAPSTAGGVVCDPQLGCSDSLVVQDLSRVTSAQYNQEFRLVSSYSGDWNFSLGANFTRFRTINDYFVFSNTFTHLLNFFPFQEHESQCVTTSSPESIEARTFDGELCRFVDPNPLEDINGEGHNYFRSANPYKLTSTAAFGELYWQATDTVKVTAGLRFTWDRKVFTPIPSQLLLADYRELDFIQDGAPPEDCDSPIGCPLVGNAPGGRGSPASPDIVQEWREPTGRLVVDWQPLLDFTDETLLYASFSRGYKGGGANPPSVAPPAKTFFDRASGGTPETFDAEFVNAYELGTKNTLFGGALVLNGAAFYYDYTDYQVSKIIDRRAVNENFDAEIWGFELESIFAPSLSWQFNAAIGYLQTEVGSGEKSIDLMDRTDGGNRHFAADPDALGRNGKPTDFPEGFDEWAVVQPFVTAASNCIVPRQLLEANFITKVIGGGTNFMHTYCPLGNFAAGSTLGNPFAYFDENGDFVLPSLGVGQRAYDPAKDAPNGGAGFFKDLGGNELPNAPHWTVALGGQYNFDLTRDWRATARVDYYWQDESYHRIYNFEPFDRLKSWSNTNLSFWVNNPQSGITVEAYVKNVFDETPITGAFLNSDDSGLTTNVFTLDPRLIGVSVRKEF